MVPAKQRWGAEIEIERGRRRELILRVNTLPSKREKLSLPQYSTMIPFPPPTISTALSYNRIDSRIPQLTAKLIPFLPFLSLVRIQAIHLLVLGLHWYTLKGLSHIVARSLSISPAAKLALTSKPKEGNLVRRVSEVASSTGWVFQRMSYSWTVQPLCWHSQSILINGQVVLDKVFCISRG